MKFAFSFTTARIAGLRLTSDAAGTTEAHAFGARDTIYSQSGVKHNAGKARLEFHLIAQNVEGQQPDTAVPSLDWSYDFDGNGTATYNLFPPTAGWPRGTYNVVVDLVADGKKHHQKTAAFTVI